MWWALLAEGVKMPVAVTFCTALTSPATSLPAAHPKYPRKKRCPDTVARFCAVPEPL